MPAWLRLPWTTAGGRWRRWLGHGLFWVVVFVFYTGYFGRAEGALGPSLVFVSLLLPVTIGTAYFLTRVLIPRYLLRRRYGFFALYVAYTLVVSVYLELLVATGIFTTIAGFRMGSMTPAAFDILKLLAGMYLVVLLVVAADLVERWYQAQQANVRLRQARLEAELKLKEAELQLLKAQIHPHFLFNTLNNLYSLTLTRSEQAPDAVLRLADLLDYLLYQGAKPVVPLAQEVAHLASYLALERLRYADPAALRFRTEGPLEGASIAPLLLLPFVENSVKHGLSRDPAGGWVEIVLTRSGDRLTFRASNSKPAAPAPAAPAPAAQAPAAQAPAAPAPAGGEGIGLANVRRRLALLYPEAHHLTIRDEPDRFDVVLFLNLIAQPAHAVPDRR
ncbi:MAG: hypothetical protein D6685_14980 [Bacteroidetes bacterium]|nr:MAG: hypothetical protein D6685_14980 [Bacteroidota bacterium]